MTDVTTTTSQTDNTVANGTNTPPIATTTHRLLLSLREAARVIGTAGATIQKIRTDNQVKIGVSEREQGCSDRILVVTGPIESVANAIGDIVVVLTDEKYAYDGEDNDNDENSKRYNYHYLNFILPPPTPAEIQENPDSNLTAIGNIRLLVTNSQLSGIIGKNGTRIKSLIEHHGVKMVASKDFLPDSDERVLEIQGFAGSVATAIIELDSITAHETDVSFTSERLYYPHSRRSSGSSASPRSSGNNAFNSNREFSVIVEVPEQYVGALVGRQGNRIANLRKFTKTKVVIDKRADDANDNPDNIRKFEIVSDHMKNVRLAESMLKRNLKTEIERRELENEGSTLKRTESPEEGN